MMDAPIAISDPVQPCADFQLLIWPQEVESDGEQDFKATLISDPKSNVDLEVGLSGQDQDAACEFTFDPAEVVLPARKQVTGTLHVRPRAFLQDYERKTYVLQVLATPSQSLAAPRKSEVRLVQVGTRPMSLTVIPPTLTSGIEADYAIAVANPSMREARLYLSAADPEGGCLYTFQPAHIVVPPRADASAKLTVKARERLEAKTAKTFKFRVEAKSERELLPAITAQGRFIQQPVREPKAELVPPQQNSRGVARYLLRITSPLPSPVSISLEASDEANALAIEINPPILTVDAGAQSAAELTVRPGASLLPGERWRVHKFTVRGKVEDSETVITANGILAQLQSIEWGISFGPAFEWGVWLGKWVLFVFALVFMATLSLSVLQELVCRNPRLAVALGPVMNSSLIRLLLDLRLTLFSQAIVRLVSDLVDALIGLAPRQCS